MPDPDDQLEIDFPRLRDRLDALGRVGGRPDGGNSRLALTDADREGRDLVTMWMRDLGLEVGIDRIGNIVARQPWPDSAAPVMAGSHIDTVQAGGRYDGNLGVLGALEAVTTVIEHGVELRRPLAVGVFTNEEGARFAPDMMGSLVYAGGLPLEEALGTRGIDGATVGEELARIGYSGSVPCPGTPPYAFVELHIEQGPILEHEGVTIGVVEGVQGISWQELTVTGQPNHAGTTPMRLRHDAGVVAAHAVVAAREIAREIGGDQVATVGSFKLDPGLVNVVPGEARLTLDLRHTDEEQLKEAESRIRARVSELVESEGCTSTWRQLARFEPVAFDPRVVDLVEHTARDRNHTTRRISSGAGHDAQMMSRLCPTGMIFVPSHRGISHNPAEHTDDSDLAAGANVLLHTLVALAREEET
ncbi:MAG: Zn-dependent hydrolase [Acidimicrobiia bacterium]|nr:Zn-dependent hydrolase [Acidimicrobiia bacterium]